MTSDSAANLTQLLIDWSEGQEYALEQLMPVVHGELRRLAARQLRSERSFHTLQATALVNEAYLRLIDQSRVRWQSRAHFFGVAAQIMRRILVDHARKRGAAKRGGEAASIPFDETRHGRVAKQAEIVALDDALRTLSDLDPRQGRVVELRFFTGASIAETAEVLGISAATVKRDWETAKAWLQRAISGRGSADG